LHQALKLYWKRKEIMDFLIRLVAWAVGSCLIAEFLGYLLRRLLHSDRVHILSRNHMQHHLLL
jgi:hypothetical protein